MGRMCRQLLGLAVAGLTLATGGAAFAELGQPQPWEWTLQQSGSPVMDNIVWFHNFLFVLITLITLFVLALLVIVVVKFNAKANPVPSRTTHNTLIEVAWTLVPVLILVGISVPSFRLLFLQLDLPKAGTAKAWMTSAPVVWTRITLLTGTTISLSTPSSRGCLSCAISESNSNLPLSG